MTNWIWVPGTIIAKDDEREVYTVQLGGPGGQEVEYGYLYDIRLIEKADPDRPAVGGMESVEVGDRVEITRPD